MSEPSGTVLNINIGAIVENFRYLRDHAGTETACVVKADCYGLGATKIVHALDLAGAREFFVATAGEGRALRDITARDIYVLGGIHHGARDDFAKYRLIPVLNSMSDIVAWSGACVIHFDTGMNRLGLSADDVDRLAAQPELLEKLDIKFGMSHFACSDEKDHPLNAAQVERFGEIQAKLPLIRRWSMCNSSGIFRVAYKYDLVRPGYALYGGNPTPETSNPMRPVVTLNARVLQTRRVKAGETIGYGATHTFDTDTETATLAFGYADGFHRGFGRASVYYNGVACPILGRVSMDLICVGIGHLPQKPAPGGVMEVLGPHQDIDQLAASAGTIGYEILTGLGTRYARVYINGS